MNRFQATRRALLLASLSTALLETACASTAAPPSYSSRPDVQQFIDAVVAQHGLDRSSVERWLDAARYSEASERLMQPPVPFAQRDWYAYRQRNLDERRIEAGVAFWRANAEALTRASERFGVPAPIIVAIIGVETFFGRITGNFRTIDVLVTLSFDYTRRADYYRNELTEFLLLASAGKIEPLELRGSFAGAVGLPQFMPGSLRRYAVDFDDDGRIDLSNSAADAIGSVGNFLAEHGWQRDLPVLFDAVASEQIVDALGGGIDAKTRWSDAQAAGVIGNLPLAPDAPVLVIDLPYIGDAGQTERLYRVGTVNFAALLRYNRSYFYATAVVELADAIARAAAAN